MFLFFNGAVDVNFFFDSELKINAKLHVFDAATAFAITQVIFAEK